MTRAEYIKSLEDDEMAEYLYINNKHTRQGLKRLTFWLFEKVNENGEASEEKDV